MLITFSEFLQRIEKQRLEAKRENYRQKDMNNYSFTYLYRDEYEQHNGGAVEKQQE